MNTKSDHILHIFGPENFHSTKSISVEFYLDSDGYERLVKGYECTMPEDRWAMCLAGCDFYIARWTGVPVFKLTIERTHQGAIIRTVTYNANKEKVRFRTQKAAIEALREVLNSFLGLEI